MNQLHSACDLSALKQPSIEQRAAVMLQQANKFGVAKCARPAGSAGASAAESPLCFGAVSLALVATCS